MIENNNKKIEVKHINNRTNSDACSKLLKYDSIHGKFNAELGFDNNHLIVNKNKVSFSQETNLENINWKKFDVDYVFECTGKFNTKDKLLSHLKNGAKKVIVSAPCKNADKTIIFGVNESELKRIDWQLGEVFGPLRALMLCNKAAFTALVQRSAGRESVVDVLSTDVLSTYFLKLMLNIINNLQ